MSLDKDELPIGVTIIDETFMDFEFLPQKEPKKAKIDENIQLFLSND